MLEQIMEKRSINHLSRFHKNDLVNSKKFRIISRQGTKIEEDNKKNNNTSLQNHYYPNPKLQKKIFNDATQVFKNPSIQKDKVDQKNSKINELFQFLSQEDASHRLIDLLNML